MYVLNFLKRGFRNQWLDDVRLLIFRKIVFKYLCTWLMKDIRFKLFQIMKYRPGSLFINFNQRKKLERLVDHKFIEHGGIPDAQIQIRKLFLNPLVDRL